MPKTSPAKLAAAKRYQAKRREDPEYLAYQRLYNKQYRQLNKERLTKNDREYQRRNATHIQLRRKGLGDECLPYIEAHEGLCDICQGPPDGRWETLTIDHDHNRDNHFRGLLCSKCNRGIGYFQDDPALLRAAAKYLERKLIPHESDILGAR